MDKQTPLRVALRMNAVFSMVSSVVLLGWPNVVGKLIGFELMWLYQGIGGGLMLFSVQLVAIAQFDRIPLFLAKLASFGDFAWFLGTLVLLGLAGMHISMAGCLMLTAIAGFVALFGGLQLRGIRLIGL